MIFINILGSYLGLVSQKLKAMNLRRLLIALAIIASFSTCKKVSTISSESQIQDPYLDSALEFLHTNLSVDEYSDLNITYARILKFHNQNIGIQIPGRRFPNDFLILQNGSGNYSGNWVTLSGLKLVHPKYQSGTIILKSLDRKSTTELMVDSNEVVKIIKTTENKVSSNTLENAFVSRLGNSSRSERAPVTVLPEVVVYYDIDNGTRIGNAGGGGEDAYSSLYWYFDQNNFYYSLYTGAGDNTNQDTHGAGNYTQNVAAALTFISPEKPIVSLKEELKCFTIDNSSSYTISVNVNQPEPNTREIFNVYSDNPVGHTFLTLTQHNADGSITIRNVGFYPKNYAKPGHDVDQSVFGDDSNTPFDASLEFTVSGTDFNTITNTLVNQQAINYNLNNFNCTNSAIDALKSININLPDTKSMDLLFSGSDPADLGEDIKNLNLEDFKNANGNRDVKRKVTNNNDQLPPTRKGTC